MSIRRHATVALGLCLAAFFGATSAVAEGARINIDTAALEKLAKSTVNVTITPQTVEWALQAMGQRGEDTAEARRLLKDIEQVLVRVFEFEQPQPWDELAKVADPILAQLKGPGWTPVVSISENGKGGRETVNVSLYSDSAGKPGGLAVLVADSKDLIIVNIAGPIDLAKLSQIMKVLNLPQIPGVTDSTPPGVAAAGGPRGKIKEKAKDKEKTAK
jgi:hypothetical protein